MTGLRSILKNYQTASQKSSGSAIKGTTGNQQTKKGPKTPQSNGSAKGNQTQKHHRSQSSSHCNPSKKRKELVSEIIKAVCKEMENRSRAKSKGNNGCNTSPKGSGSNATQQKAASNKRWKSNS